MMMYLWLSEMKKIWTFFTSLKSLKKGAGSRSGSISQRYGSGSGSAPKHCRNAAICASGGAVDEAAGNHGAPGEPRVEMVRDLEREVVPIRTPAEQGHRSGLLGRRAEPQDYQRPAQVQYSGQPQGFLTSCGSGSIGCICSWAAWIRIR